MLSPRVFLYDSEAGSKGRTITTKFAYSNETALLTCMGKEMSIYRGIFAKSSMRFNALSMYTRDPKALENAIPSFLTRCVKIVGLGAV